MPDYPEALVPGHKGALQETRTARYTKGGLRGWCAFQRSRANLGSAEGQHRRMPSLTPSHDYEVSPLEEPFHTALNL